MTRVGRCCVTSASRSGPTEGSTHGKDSPEGQAGPQAQVRRTRLHPLPAVRPPQGRVPQVRPLPDLPAGHGPPGRAPGHPEVQLVTTPMCPELVEGPSTDSGRKPAAGPATKTAPREKNHR